MAPIDENINETHLKWFGYVQNKAINVPSSPSWRFSRKEEKGSTRTSRWRLYLWWWFFWGKRDSPCFRITDLRLFNRPLNAYNTKNTKFVSNHNSRTKDFEKVLENNLENKLSAFELTKRGFNFVKNVLRCCLWVLKREKRVLENMEAKKSLTLAKVLI